MSQKLKDLVTILICDDVQDSIRYYTEVLGFRVTNRMDNVGQRGRSRLRERGDNDTMAGA